MVGLEKRLKPMFRIYAMALRTFYTFHFCLPIKAIARYNQNSSEFLAANPAPSPLPQ
jgi:hypothetical protein